MPLSKVHESPDPRTILLVHGNNHIARDAVAGFLRSAGLNPMMWETAAAHARTLHKTLNPYIGQILEVGMAKAHAVVVIFTGDDLARIKATSQHEDLSPQARANVIFEAGMALALHPARTLFLQIGELRGMSDIAGQHVIRLDGTAEKLRELMNALKVAGCPVIESQASLKPLGDELCQHESRRYIEIPLWSLAMVCACVVLLCFAAGLLSSSAWEHLSPEKVSFRGAISTTREPVTAYLAVDQSRKVASGPVELLVRHNPSYVVLYEVGTTIIDIEPLKAGEALPIINVDQAFFSRRSDCESQPIVHPNIRVADRRTIGVQE